MLATSDLAKEQETWGPSGSFEVFSLKRKLGI